MIDNIKQQLIKILQAIDDGSAMLIFDETTKLIDLYTTLERLKIEGKEYQTAFLDTLNDYIDNFKLIDEITNLGKVIMKLVDIIPLTVIIFFYQDTKVAFMYYSSVDNSKKHIFNIVNSFSKQIKFLDNN